MKWGRGEICADCKNYRDIDRYHGTCPYWVWCGGLVRIRWNRVACEHFEARTS